ncbi:hypothetical protein J0H58_28960 [bacterium]|nr:hypothetical protein [bacterium]
MNPRGSIVMPSRPVDIGGGVMVTGRKPGIIVYIESTAKNRRELERFCNRNGIDARPVQFVREDMANAYECVGTVESLERLTGHPVVADWHLIIAVAIPRTGAGAAELSVNAERAARLSKMRRADREALAETQRRERLPREERERLELAGLLELERALAE